MSTPPASSGRGGRFVRRIAGRLAFSEATHGDTWDAIQLARHQDRPYPLDYIARLMLDFEELHARIRAVVRRHQGRAISRMTAGEVTLDLATHAATYRDVSAILSAKEFALLQALAERPGAILSRRQLEDRLYDWGNEVESNAVDVLIHYVRRRFDKEIVQNVRGVGWMIPQGGL